MEGSTMYAIIKAGGKQYRVQPGETIYVERLVGAVGDKVTLTEVLMVSGDGGTQIGAPSVPSASVVGTVVGQVRDHKVRVFKFKHRKHYRKTRGHRQYQTALKVDAINV
jgi:large subunit ribosomal protein L21